MIFAHHKKIFLTFVALLITVGISRTFAQTTPAQPPTADEKAQLQQQLSDLENQIAQYQQELSQIQGQKNTLQNKLNLLKKQQAALNLQMLATTLQLNDLSGQISDTQTTIVQAQARITKLKSQIAEVLQLVYEQDNYPLVLVFLSKNTLSDALSELETSASLTSSLNTLISQVTVNLNDLLVAKQQLESQQIDTSNLLAIQNLQQGQLADTATQQSSLLNATKGKESNYQTILNNAQQQADVIRTRLYQLLGVGTQITFGQAVDIANWASAQTGVRPAFLLAILTQESNLGKNVGTCNRPGDPPSKSWRVVMKPERDQQPFLQITKDLGMDPDITPVSCPMHDKQGNQIGWGGAMGPAQFIPSTWLGYKDRVAAITGKPANPWDIRDAFLAAAIKLASDGATVSGGEWAAAMRYFSGSTNPRYSFYGDSVIATANQYQSDIDNLNK